MKKCYTYSKNEIKTDDKVNLCGKKIEKIKYIDGNYYYGEVNQWLKDGLGFLKFNEYSYRGYFKNDKFEGAGQLSTPEYKVKGYWINGNLLKISQIVDKFA